MGTVIELAPSAAPFGLEVGSRSISLSVRPSDGDGPVLSAVETGKRTGAFLVGHEHLVSLRVVLDAALAHPKVQASLGGASLTPTAVAEGTPDGLLVTLGMLRVHGHSGTAPGEWGSCSGVEVLHVDLPWIHDAVTAETPAEDARPSA
jgi:hypothetical protein